MSTEHFASIGLEAYHIPNIDLNALTQKLESLYKEVWIKVETMCGGP